MSVAATHVAVDDSGLASYAQRLLETGGKIELSDNERTREMIER
jgi:hypothetical protein